MSKLIYTAITSLDGYIEDEDGKFGWAVPDAEVHTFVNDLEATIGTHLYGRRMYQTMAVWQTVGDAPEVSPAEAEYAQMWRATDKVVYSRTLDEAWTPHTRLEHEDRVRRSHDCLGQQSALVKSDITRRCADQTRDRVRLGVLAHVKANEFDAENLGELFRNFCFTDARRTREQK